MDAARSTRREEPVGTADRACAWCGSSEGRFVTRGFAGATDANDQYFECASCKRKTFEILSQTGRDMRLGRYKAGDTYHDRANRTRYQIGRVLRVGSNEFLLYLKPLDPSDPPTPPER
jgi:hypothetical protein